MLHSFCQANPSVKIVVVPPLARSVPSWFNPYLPCFTSYLFGEVSKHGSTQIRYLSPFVAPAQYFDADGVHLNPEAGLQFIQYVLSGIDQVFPVLEPQTQPHSQPPSVTASSIFAPSYSFTAQPTVVPSYSDALNVHSQATTNGPASIAVPLSVQSSSSNLATDFGHISSALATISGVTSTMRADFQTRREQDNLIFARLKEDRNFELNKNRENRFTVTGLIATGVPTDPKERKEFFKHKLQLLVDEACPELEPRPEVLDVYVNMRYGQSSPFLEGRMDSSSSSSAFRTAASKLAKEESPNFRDLFVANACYTLNPCPDRDSSRHFKGSCHRTYELIRSRLHFQASSSLQHQGACQLQGGGCKSFIHLCRGRVQVWPSGDSH